MKKLNIVLAVAALAGYANQTYTMHAEGAETVANPTAALLRAAKKHDLALIKSYLKQGASVNAQDAKGNTPLHYVLTGKMYPRSIVEEVRVLVNHGANPYVKNNAGISPINIKIADESIRSEVRALLESYSSHAEGQHTLASDLE